MHKSEDLDKEMKKVKNTFASDNLKSFIPITILNQPR